MKALSTVIKEKVDQEAYTQFQDFIDSGGSLSLEALQSLKSSHKQAYHHNIIKEGGKVVEAASKKLQEVQGLAGDTAWLEMETGEDFA